MRYQDIIIKVYASNNLEAFSGITGIPAHKVKPNSCIDIFCKGNKIRDWAWVRKARTGLLAILFG